MTRSKQAKIFLRTIYWEISIETPSISFVLADHFHQHTFSQGSTVVLSFHRFPCSDIVCLVFLRVHQLRQELLKCQVFMYDDSSGNGTEPMQSKYSCISSFKWCYFVWYSVSIIAVWGDRKWCRRQFGRHGQCLQWGKEIFNACVRRWKCASILKDGKIDNDVPW